MGNHYAMCYICKGYAEAGCKIGKQRYLDDPSIYRCKKCYKREMRIKEIRDRVLEKRNKRREKKQSEIVADSFREFADTVSDTIAETITTIIEPPEKPKYDPDQDSNLTKLQVKNLPDRWKKHITEDHYEKEVYIIVDNSRKDTTRELIDILNERFVRRQLELKNRIANNRDMYYQCLTRLGDIDLKGESLQQQISIDGAVKSFCDSLINFFDVPYWGYVQDELGFMATARTTAYSIAGQSFQMDQNMMTTEYFGNDKNEFYDLIRKTPFFFVICEKELVIMETMEALRDLGYKDGWLGFNTQGYASTNVIRTLIEYRDNISKKFCVFSLHDFDVEGIKIFLDMKRYFNVESAGLNPELMVRSGIDFTTKGQKYRGGTGEAKPATIKGAMTIIDDLFDKGIIDNKEKKEYIEWVDACSKKRYELQSITGARLDEDLELNPARDYAEYIQHKLEDFDRTWDINRLTEVRNIPPDTYSYTFEKPAFIEEIVNDLQTKISDTIDLFLESKDLKDTQDWRDLLLTKYGFLEGYEFLEKTLDKVRNLQKGIGRIKAIRVRRKHKRYRDSLRTVNIAIKKERDKMWELHYSHNRFLRKRRERQTKTIERLLKRFPEYSDVKEKLENIQEQVEKALEEIEKEIEKEQEEKQ